MIEPDPPDHCSATHSVGADNGNQSLRAELVPRHASMVLAICLASTGRPQDAEDLMQETFVKAFAGLDRLRDHSKARAWLRQIARGVCIDHLRRRKPVSSIPDDLASPVEGHDPRIDRLHATLAKLPEDYRETISLYYLDGRSCAGVATTLGITAGAVRMRLLRARVMLYDMLTRDEE